MKRSDIPADEILAACRAFHRGHSIAMTPEQALAHKYHPKLVLAKMEQLCQQDVLTYGVSLRTAWVVEDEMLKER